MRRRWLSASVLMLVVIVMLGVPSARPKEALGTRVETSKSLASPDTTVSDVPPNSSAEVTCPSGDQEGAFQATPQAYSGHATPQAALKARLDWMLPKAPPDLVFTVTERTGAKVRFDHPKLKFQAVLLEDGLWYVTAGSYCFSASREWGPPRGWEQR